MNRTHINLLTWRFRLYLVVRERLLQWLVVWSIIGLTGPISWQLKKRRLTAATDELALLESRCVPLKQIQIENRQMTKRLAELGGHQSLLSRLHDHQVPYRLMGLISRSAGQAAGGVQLKNIGMRQVQEKLAADLQTISQNGKANEPVYQEITVLKLNGVASDNIAISRFVAALRDSGVFANVELRSSVGARVNDARSQSFVVECRLIHDRLHVACGPVNPKPHTARR